MARDRRHTKLLRDSGWRVLRFWETDIKRQADVIVAKVIALVGASQDQTRPSSSKRGASGKNRQPV